MTELTLYETAREALAEALRVDEVMEVRDYAERMRLYGKQARDRRMMADAMALQIRAERKLGVLLINAKEAGQLGIGRRSNLAAPRSGEDANRFGDPVPTGDAENPGNGSGAEQFPEDDIVDVKRVTLAEAGIDRKLSMKAQAWARLGDEEFEQRLAEVRDKLESAGAIVVNPLKDFSTAEKKAKRQAREAELGKKQMALPEAKFGVILADPEWQFETRSEAGMDRSADNHYPTSALEAIKGRDVGSLAADDAVLFLWATVPMLPQALEVMAAWGFAYKSHWVWAKDRIGTGFWNRNQHELLLLGTRGNPPAPAMGDQWPSLLAAPVGAHSEKPAFAYEIAEAYFPSLPKIELNARTARTGWARWGYEAPEEDSPETANKMDRDRDHAHVAHGNVTSGKRPEGEPVEPEAGAVSHPEAGENPAPHPIPEAAALPEQPHGEHPGQTADAVAGGAIADAPPSAEAAGEAPSSASPAAPAQKFKSTAETDAAIALYYAATAPEDFDLDGFATRLGATKLQVRRRANQLGLSSRERQRAAASAHAKAQHERGEL